MTHKTDIKTDICKTESKRKRQNGAKTESCQNGIKTESKRCKTEIVETATENGKTAKRSKRKRLKRKLKTAKRTVSKRSILKRETAKWSVLKRKTETDKTDHFDQLRCRAAAALSAKRLLGGGPGGREPPPVRPTFCGSLSAPKHSPRWTDGTYIQMLLN